MRAGGSAADTRGQSRCAGAAALASAHAPPGLVQCCPGGAGGAGAAVRRRPATAIPTAAPSDGPRRPRPELRKTERQPVGRRVDVSRQAERAKRAASRHRQPARGHDRPADPLDDPGQGRGPGLRHGHQQRHRDLADDQRLRLHLRRADDHLGRSSRRPPTTPPDAFVGERITDDGHHDTIAELAPGESAPFSFNVPRRLLEADSPGRLLVRRARARRGTRRPRHPRRRPGPHLPAAGAPGHARASCRPRS